MAATLELDHISELQMVTHTLGRELLIEFVDFVYDEAST